MSGETTTTVVVILLLSLMGAGVGFAVGLFVQPPVEATGDPTPPGKPEVEASGSTENPAAPEPARGEEPSVEVTSTDATPLAELKIVAIPPVLTTLAAPQGKWIRFEGSILVRQGAETPPDLLAERSGEQILAYLRTVRLEQLQGPSGLLALKDDLNENIRTLSKGQVQGLLIHGLLVE